jgi:hypothetical protein
MFCRELDSSLGVFQRFGMKLPGARRGGVAAARVKSADSRFVTLGGFTRGANPFVNLDR